MTFSPGTAASVVAAKLELTLSCRGLHDADVFSLSDPMVVVEEMVRLFSGSFRRCSKCFKVPGTRNWHELGRTKIIWGSSNPDFKRKFQLDYHFEVHQEFRFSVYDIHSGMV